MHDAPPDNGGACLFMALDDPRRVLVLLAALAASFSLFAQPTDRSRRSAAAEDDQAAARRRMVNEQIADRDVTDRRVLEAMRKVPRHRFVPPAMVSRAYDDSPLPIGYNQTISQPFIVAHMTEALDIQSSHKVLEIGTGSGYQAAVLGELARIVYTIEIVPELARGAAATLKGLGYSNVHVRAGDGYAGWPEQAPFDRIMLTAAPEEIPKPLIDQLAPRGRLLAPVGEQGAVQWLTIVEKTPRGVTQRRTLPVRFVPFTRDR